MQSNKTCPLVEQYLGYLAVIKGRSENTVKEYRTDLLMFFSFVMASQYFSFCTFYSSLIESNRAFKLITLLPLLS
ncbi:site-specific integrase [Desulfosporosinus shakirovi]|uniref:site-specific integrase n=1 Tax=Desulfosporosinus shakirovi TaxID=2885154 RepID=UPI001E2C65D2|nr:site-specific integrase [Desulfosporosinus sp. SRJS8]MCB8817100.1 site-specific integrase [Desulfosporosinus sp. SRJS8]